MLSHGDYRLSEDEMTALDQLISRLVLREPLAYLLGRADFYDQTFMVNPGVLIPRPETEHLVEEAIRWAKIQARPLDLVDIGTGSGCILVTLVNHFPTRLSVGIDLSWKSLCVARSNSIQLSAKSSSFIQADLLTSFDHMFDLVCANLPYIPSQVVDTLHHAKFEPRAALDGGQAGFETILRLLSQLPSHLKTPGLALLEIQNDQGERLTASAAAYFPQADISILKDYAGIDRVLKIELPGSN